MLILRAPFFLGGGPKTVYFEDVIVGSVCCRVDEDAAASTRKLYIMTLGCLAPYRRRGLGKRFAPCS